MQDYYDFNELSEFDEAEKAKKKEALRVYLEVSDIRQILAMEAGKRFFGDMFKHGFMEDQIFSGNSAAYHKLGIHERTIRYWIMVQYANIEAFIQILLMDEQNDEEQLLNDIRDVLETHAGVRFFTTLFKSGHIQKSNLFTGNSTTYFNLGLRRFTRRYWNLVKAANPEAFSKILRMMHKDLKPLTIEQEIDDD